MEKNKMKHEKYTIEKCKDVERNGYQLRINDGKRAEYMCWVVPNSEGSYSAKSRYAFNGEKFSYDLGTYDTLDKADQYLQEHIFEMASDQVNATNSADDWYQKPMNLGAGPIPTTNDEMLFILGVGRRERCRATLENLIS